MENLQIQGFYSYRSIQDRLQKFSKNIWSILTQQGP